MLIELRLNALLKELDLDYHGSRKELAESCGVHRHTIAKLCSDEMSNPSLDVLSDICRWIKHKKQNTNFDPSILPGALFGLRPTKLWRAFGKSDSVTIYLGEYKQKHEDMPNIPAHRSVARSDAEVESMIMRCLSSTETMGADRPAVHTRFIPFQYTWINPCPDVCEFELDKKRAMKVFRSGIRKRGEKESVILLGSQRVNYLVECLVAELYGCRPFAPATGVPKVPFFLCYRDFDRSVKSCFGGRDFPPGYKIRNKAEFEEACEKYRKKHGKKSAPQPMTPGTYYLRDRKGPWELCPWIPDREDAGIVIINREAVRIEMAVFGFSGPATCAVGRYLIDHPEKFWPEGSPDDADSAVTTTIKGIETGIYLCRVKFPPKNTSRQGKEEDEDYKSARVEVIPLPLWS